MKYLRSAMRRSKHRKPPSLHLKTTSRETSPRCSSVLSDWDADDEGFMSSGDFAPSRPLSLTIPSGPYCPRRPTLQEVLANVAPPPWTLTAFMAYLSQNHCLETLEFTMDAQRYTKHYQELVSRDPHTPLSPNTPECDYVRMLWQKLLDAYIAPNGPREVNLPSDVRDHLLSLPFTYSPPDPAELEPAVKIIYELMDESVLVPFLNSIAPSRVEGFQSSPWTSNESMTDTYMTGSLDERSLSPSKTRARESSPPSGERSNDIVSQSHGGPSPRLSHSSHLTAALSRGAARLSTHLSGSSGTSGEAPESMTDDSTDSPSPSGSALEPMTPPNTPPTSHTEFVDVSPGTSPHTARGEGSSSWKKMGAKLGWKKSRSGHGSGSSTSSSRYPMGRDTSDESGGNGL
ncbi:related to a-agglutinin core protein AGA1 [Phialocephala subalpina]|uniref:Related to a-agglutinin core protein AGA1 n=1 Tax=Phialocephala subalpina TaxID=576137 RepID=A0A1L7X3I2_9HELO|nr:related to a-agglutinin core protein AGA1 [Phialocephala subalpina]